MRLVLPLALGATLFAVGCDNSCQQICDRMARYAEDCDISVSKEDVETCKDAQAGAGSRDDRAVCREYNGRQTIREEWDCDDVRAYFNITEGASPDGGDGTDG